MVRTPMAPADPVVPAAGWILRQIASGATEPLSAAIVGPGGTGKSTLLRAIANAYSAAGVTVVRAGQDTDPTAPADGVPVLVDDAHTLTPDVLTRLRESALQRDTSMVVAYRPWPRPDGLSALGAQVSRHHSPVVLGHLGRDEVAEQVARRALSAPDPLVDLVVEQSGGLPMFVGLVTQAMLDTGRFDPAHPDKFRRPQRISVSPGLAERLRYLLEALDPGVYRLFEAMALGAPLDEEVLCVLLGTDPDDLADTVEAARATGLVTEAGDLIVFVRNLVLRLIPVLRGRGMQRRLAEIQLDNGGSVLAAGRRLAESHATGARACTVLAAAADEALRTSPRLAVELYDAATRAGGGVRAKSAQAAALAGDPARALRLADQILTGDSPEPDVRRALSVSAAVLANQGFAARAAELSLQAAATGSAESLIAVPALVACGEVARAREVMAAAPPASADAPTLTAAAIRLLAEGMLESVDGEPAVAVSHLAQAAGLLESAGDAVLLPYSAAELVAVVSAQCGEPALAEATVGPGATSERHLLLYGWQALRRGAVDTARGVLDRVRGGDLYAAALAAGIARQSGDTAALAAAFARARTALIKQPVDLYLLRQLGELSIAAALLGMRPTIATQLKSARALLARLGDPPLWTAALRWSDLHAELAAGDVPAAAEVDLSGTAYESAGACWLRVAGGDQPSVTAVRSAAATLHHHGLTWDGARLAAEAALRLTDRKAAAGLLAYARSLTDGTEVLEDTPEPQLSDRELEVGRLILAGLTHKQIGARLFISAKTVEHHVSRMRHRLGADGRNELFGMLRTLVATADQPEALPD